MTDGVAVKVMTNMKTAGVVLARPKADFGRWLESRIYPKGWGPVEFGEAVGVAPSAVSGWLNSGVRPYKRTCYAIAAALGVPIDEVLIAAGYPPEGRRAKHEEPDIAVYEVEPGVIPAIQF